MGRIKKKGSHEEEKSQKIDVFEFDSDISEGDDESYEELKQMKSDLERPMIYKCYQTFELNDALMKYQDPHYSPQ